MQGAGVVCEVDEVFLHVLVKTMFEPSTGNNRGKINNMDIYVAFKFKLASWEQLVFQLLPHYGRFLK